MSISSEVLNQVDHSTTTVCKSTLCLNIKRRRLFRRLLVMLLIVAFATQIVIFAALPVAATTNTYYSSTQIAPAHWPQIGAQNQLSYYDQAATSTTFGEPVFRLEPTPSVIQMDPKRGVTLMCLASGNPLPKISWYSSALGVDIGQNGALSTTTTTTKSGSNNLINVQGVDGDQLSRPVTNISGLCEIVNGGTALRLLPFDDELGGYRPEIHSAEYRCVASNPIATIHSRSAQVQAGK